MDFKAMKRKAFVDDKPIDVTPNMTAGDVLSSQGYDATNRSLVQVAPSGSPVVLKPNDRINLNNGNRFDSQLNAVEGV